MKKIVATLKYLVTIGISAMLILSVLRLVFYFANSAQVGDVDGEILLLLQAMLKGLQFDNVICSSIMLYPAIILLSVAVLNKISKFWVLLSSIFFVICFAIVFAISCADIPYFSYFFGHLNGSVLNWAGFNSSILGMVFSDLKNYIFIVLFLAVVALFAFVVKKAYTNLIKENEKEDDLNQLPPYLFLPFAWVVWSMFAVFRVVLYHGNTTLYMQITGGETTPFISWMNTLRIDNIFCGVAFFLPIVTFGILFGSKKISFSRFKLSNIQLILASTLVLAIITSPISLLPNAFAHFGGAILNWFNISLGNVILLIEYHSPWLFIGFYIGFVALFISMVIIFGKALLATHEIERSNYQKVIFYLPIILLVWFALSLGKRGTISGYPIGIDKAYFSNNSFFNQLGLNATFFFARTAGQYLQEYDPLKGEVAIEDAIAFAKNELGVIDSISANPIERKVASAEEPIEPNIVVIIEESFSMESLNMQYNGKPLMPFATSLKDKSFFFPNIYSTGTHTNNGIVSILYGYPAYFGKGMMPENPNHYQGLPVTLHQKGYQTLFFTTGNAQFDNMNSTCLENGFERIYSDADYPKSKIANNWGVPDDYLFEFGIQKLNESHATKKPFFATLLTISNHPPFVVPPQFKNAGGYDKEQILAFADHCLNQFMQNAAKQAWYSNTIFVIVGDHGSLIHTPTYNMPLELNHIPLFIFSPLFNGEVGVNNRFGNQTDIFPTIMGLLKTEYTNNSMGEDLFKVDKRQTYFTSDNYLGCINDQFFYTYHPETKTEGLYDYKNKSTDNRLSEYRAVADSMKTYSFSMLATSNYLHKNKLTGPQK